MYIYMYVCMCVCGGWLELDVRFIVVYTFPAAVYLTVPLLTWIA